MRANYAASVTIIKWYSVKERRPQARQQVTGHILWPVKWLTNGGQRTTLISYVPRDPYTICFAICHMGMHDVAAEFRVIACHKTVEDSKTAMGGITIPKQVMGSLNKIDPIAKCLWILEQRYNCRGFGSLNVQQLLTPHHVVAVLSTIRLPMIASFVGKHSLYNHVVVVWNGRIIDFESRVTYSVNEENVNRICGPNNPFVAVTQGYVILPSKKMKAAVKDFSDWGEKVLREEHSNLFMFRK